MLVKSYGAGIVSCSETKPVGTLNDDTDEVDDDEDELDDDEEELDDE